MPMIPTGSAIQRRDPVSNRSVATYDPSGETSALIQAADSVNQTVQRAMEVKRQNRNRLDGLRAQSEYAKGSAALKEAYEADDDFESMGERYNQDLGNLRSEVIRNVRDPQLREELGYQLEEMGVRQQSQINGLALKKETDYERADLSGFLVENRQQILKDPQNAGAMLQLGLERINAAEEGGHLTEQEAQRARDQHGVSVAIGMAKTKEPRERVEYLKNSKQAQLIPEDQRIEMLRVAEGDGIDAEALDIGRDIMADHPNDEAAALKAAKAVSDPKVRAKAIAEVEANFIDKRRLEEAAKVETFGDAYDFMSSGGTLTEWKEANPESFADLDPARRSSLEKADSQGLVTYADANARSVIMKANDMLGDGDKKGAAAYLNENQAALPMGDFKSLYAKTQDKQYKPTLELTTKQFATKLATNSAGVPDKRAAERIFYELSDRIQTYRNNNNGDEPPPQIMKAYEDQLMDTYTVVDGGFAWFDADVKGYEYLVNDQAGSVDANGNKLTPRQVMNGREFQKSLQAWEGYKQRPATDAEKAAILRSAKKQGRIVDD